MMLYAEARSHLERAGQGRAVGRFLPGTQHPNPAPRLRKVSCVGPRAAAERPAPLPDVGGLSMVLVRAE